MSISINGSELFGKNKNSFAVSNKYAINSGLGLTSEKEQLKANHSIQIRKVNSIFSANQISERQKKKISPEAIARKIAQGKPVTHEEKLYLIKMNPELYRKAETANRLREKLEEALKSAQSETAKATAVSEVSAQATTLAMMDAKSEDGDTVITGAELYSDAIQAALKKEGSQKLNEELEPFTNIESKWQNKNSLEDNSLEENNLEENEIDKYSAEECSKE